MTQNTDANSWLMAGASVPSCTFPQIGARQGGTLVEPAPFTQQQRDLATNQPKFWDNGDPMQQLVVTVQTNDRDPANPEDDGVRRLYVKGQMQKAVAEGVRRGGGRGLNVGDELFVTFVAQEEPKSRGFNGAKVYQAEFSKGNGSASFLAKAPEAGQYGQPQAAPQPGAYTPPAQWQQPAPAPVPAQQYAAPAATAYQQQTAQQLPPVDAYAQQLAAVPTPQAAPAPAAQAPTGMTPELAAALAAAGITGIPGA